MRLHGLPYTPSFMAEYEAALKGESLEPIEPKSQKGTLAWACDQYCEKSIAYARLDEQTAHVRRQNLDKICAEPTTPTSKTRMGNVPIDAFTPKAVRVIRDRIGRNAPEQANAYVKALRQVFKYAVEAELITNNPTRDVSMLAGASEGHHSWTIDEVAQYEDRHPVGTRARLAMALMLYTGQRRSDAVLLGPDHVKDGWLVFTQWKNRKRNPVRMEIPIRPELQAIIDKSPCGRVTFLVTERGKPFTAHGFGNWFRERCIEADVPGRAHGLRKACRDWGS